MFKFIQSAMLGLIFTLATHANAQTIGIAGAPSGFGLADGNAAVSLAGTYGADRGDTRFDASTSVSVGVGNAVSGIGLQGSMNVTSFRDFGASGYFSLTGHKMFQFNDRGIYSVSANASYLSTWGDSISEEPGYSVVGTYLTSFGDQLGMITLGAANDLSPNRGEWDLVAGIGVGVGSYSAVSLAQTADTTILGVTISPDRLAGNSFSASLSNVSNSNDPTFGFTFGRSFSVRRQ